MYIVCGRFLLANWVRFYFLKTAGCTQCVSNIQKLNFSTTKTPDFLIMQQNCLKNKLKENCKQISECLTLIYHQFDSSLNDSGKENQR